MKMPALEQAVRTAFEWHGWPQAERSLLAAVSGGPDSMAMAHVLHGMGLLGGIAHVNYGLREAAEVETAAVRSLAEKLMVPFYLLRESYQEGERRSVQLWAREVRYRFFEEIIQEEQLAACALGHHADDQVETILFRLLRSRSVHPLSGIPAKRGPFIRPFLSVSKQEILDYCREWNLPFCLDESNLESKYVRNQIRNELLPVLRRVNPRIRERLIEASHDLKDRDEWVAKKLRALARQCSKETGSIIFLNTTCLLNLDPDLSLAMVMAWWLDDALGLEGNEIRTVLVGLNAMPGAKWMLKGGELKREVNGWTWIPETMQSFHPRGADQSDIIYVFEGVEASASTASGWRIEGKGCTRKEWLDAAGDDNREVYMDAERLRFPLRVRKWRLEDKIKPIGLKGTKRVKDLIQEGLKRGVVDSQDQLVVEDAHGVIVYVSGCRISEAVRVLPDSRIVFRVHITHSA